MPTCDYCGESFDTEDAELNHLTETHADELGRIDQRRVTASTQPRSLLTTSTSIALILLVIVILAVFVYVLFVLDTDTNSTTQADLPSKGDPALLTDVQEFPAEGTDHVPEGTTINYETSPPTSGPHYDTPATAGFYTDPIPAGELVHSLEHGAVVMYYDHTTLSSNTKEELTELANTYTDPWASVIVVPYPEDTHETPYTLTAWRHKLTLDDYDAEVVRAFLAEYLGRGPEHPVR